MITKYKDSVKNTYRDLYEAINKASKGEIQIDNLESFFGNIQEIAKLDTKFLRLPLDEPLFEIDANSRKITVPSNFATNGLSVQGDHLAETVYFSIDRYFDYMDLDNCQIRINWKMGEASGQSVNFSKSLDADPGKIIFGWPVAKELTGKSGSLSFAVEFYIEDKDNITYSLNTLISTITIKEGLVLISPEVINVNNNILNMLQNSAFGEGDAKVEAIKWLTGGLVINPEDVEALNQINLMGNASEGIDGVITLKSTPVTLYARASAGDAEIHYTGQVPTGATEPTDTYILVSKTNSDGSRIPLDVNEIYYTKDIGGKAYKEADQADIDTWNNKEIITPTVKEFYARYSNVSVDRVGEYVIKAQGVKFDNKNRKIGQGPVESTEVVYCPNPEIPSNISIATNDIDLDTGYSIANDKIESIAFLVDAEPAELTISSEGYDNIDAYAPVDGTPKALIQYNIYKDEAKNAFTQSKWIRPNENFNFRANEEGKYIIGVKSFLNNKLTDDEAKSNVFTVSHLASKIQNVSLEIKNNRIDLAEAVDGVLSKNSTAIVNVTYDFDKANAPYSNKVSVELYYVGDDGAEAKIETPLTVEDIESGKAITITSALIQNLEGNYKFRLHNEYNGSIYTVDSNSFYINIR